jgi:hypothetical protein
MTVGTVYTLYGNGKACKYLCIYHGPGGWDLKRVMRATTKADNNRFPETMTINIGPNTLPAKKKK